MKEEEEGIVTLNNNFYYMMIEVKDSCSDCLVILTAVVHLSSSDRRQAAELDTHSHSHHHHSKVDDLQKAMVISTVSCAVVFFLFTFLICDFLYSGFSFKNYFYYLDNSHLHHHFGC